MPCSDETTLHCAPCAGLPPLPSDPARAVWLFGDTPAIQGSATPSIIGRVSRPNATPIVKPNTKPCASAVTAMAALSARSPTGCSTSPARCCAHAPCSTPHSTPKKPLAKRWGVLPRIQSADNARRDFRRQKMSFPERSSQTRAPSLQNCASGPLKNPYAMRGYRRRSRRGRTIRT